MRRSGTVVFVHGPRSEDPISCSKASRHDGRSSSLASCKLHGAITSTDSGSPRAAQPPRTALEDVRGILSINARIDRCPQIRVCPLANTTTFGLAIRRGVARTVSRRDGWPAKSRPLPHGCVAEFPRNLVQKWGARRSFLKWRGWRFQFSAEERGPWIVPVTRTL